MKKNFLMFILLQLVSFSLFALPETYSATGIGKTEAEARTDAMSSLASSLQSNVQTVTLATETVTQKNSKSKIKKELNRSVSVYTDVPLYGVEFSKSRKGKDNKNYIDAEINVKSAAPMYEKELQNLAKKLEATFPSLKNEKVRENALALYEDFDKLSAVSVLFGVKTPDLSLNRTAFDLEVQKYTDRYDSIYEAANVIARNITKGKVYVCPVTFEGMPGVSEFSYTLQQYISENLGKNASVSQSRALYVLSGTCFRGQKNDDGEYDLNVTYHLTNAFGTTIYATPVMTFLPVAYEGKSYIPTGLDFQYELADGKNAFHDFDVEIQINEQKDNVILRSGENAYISVKASEDCFIYIVGYVFNNETQNEPFAYLFPLNIEENGKKMFIRHVEKNKWIDINPAVDGETLPIEIIPPFGVEILQVFASTQKNIDEFLADLPAYSATEDYYVVGNPEKALSASRGMNIKKVNDASKNRILNSETRITYTTRK